MLKEPTLLHGHYLCRVRRILRMYIMPTTTLTLNRIEIIIRETLLFILFRTPVMAQKINPKKIKKQPSRPPMRTATHKKKKMVNLGFEPRLGESEPPVITTYTNRPIDHNNGPSRTRRSQEISIVAEENFYCGRGEFLATKRQFPCPP